MIFSERIYKVKDTVDIYLQEDIYIVVFFMSIRLRKRFKVGKVAIDLLAEIDGCLSAAGIYERLIRKYPELTWEDFCVIMGKLLLHKIIYEKIIDHVLDEYYLNRYDRQISYFGEFFDSEVLAEKAQKKIIESRIGIIGCGSVGGNIAIQLAMAGVESFVIMDFDVCEESDASRHIYFDPANNGRKKVEALSDRLKEINPRIKTFISYSGFNPKMGFDDFLSRVDFVVDAADEPYMGFTANLLSQMCVPRKIPHYIAGGFDAHLASTGEIVIPYVTPCAACYSTFFEDRLKNWTPEEHPVRIRLGEMGGLASASLFASSFACMEIVKFLCGLTDMSKSYKKRGEFYIDGMRLMYLDPDKDPNCRVCGGLK